MLRNKKNASDKMLVDKIELKKSVRCVPRPKSQTERMVKVATMMVIKNILLVFT